MEEMTLMLQVDGNRPAAPASPRVVLVVGVNGSGKTTSIAKLGYIYKRDSSKVMLAAADTFRAAAIDQLKWWGDKIGAEVVAHQPGADPGAVVFDAIQAAKTRGAQTVIVDTAGRLQTKFNLMEELKKIRRVVQRVDPTAPHETLLVLDANTGQNGVSQAKYFTEAVGITGIILTKLDSTAKGGIVLAICDQLKIPVRFIGTGETVEDLAPFDPKSFVEAMMS
jgi:fused signal recognition particle receptor